MFSIWCLFLKHYRASTTERSLLKRGGIAGETAGSLLQAWCARRPEYICIFEKIVSSNQLFVNWGQASDVADLSNPLLLFVNCSLRKKTHEHRRKSFHPPILSPLSCWQAIAQESDHGHDQSMVASCCIHAKTTLPPYVMIWIRCLHLAVSITSKFWSSCRQPLIVPCSNKGFWKVRLLFQNISSN